MANDHATRRAPRRLFLTAVALGLIAPNHGEGAEIFKAPNNDPLNSPSSWIGNQVPTPADIANFTTYSSDDFLELGQNTHWAGIRAGPGTVRLGGSPFFGPTLTLGAAGIELSGEPVPLAMFAFVDLSADQTWSIPFFFPMLNSLNLGSFTLTKTGTGTLALGNSTHTGTGSLLVQQGTLEISGRLQGGAQVNISPGASLTGTGTLTGPVALAGSATSGNEGAIRLAGSTLTLADLTVGGTTTGERSRIIMGVAHAEVSQVRVDSLVVGLGGLVVTPVDRGAYPGDVFPLIVSQSALPTANIVLDPAAAKSGFNSASLQITGNTLSVAYSGPAVPAVAYWQGAYGTSWSAIGGPSADQSNFTTTASGEVNTGQYPGPITNVYFNNSAPLATSLDRVFIIKSLTLLPGSGPLSVDSWVHGLTIGSGGVTSGKDAGTLTLNRVILDTTQSWTNASSSPVTVLHLRGNQVDLSLAGIFDFDTVMNIRSITLNSGSLTLRSGSFLSPPLALTNHGTVLLDTIEGRAESVGASISGAGQLYITPKSNIRLIGNNTYTGTTTIDAGTLTIASLTNIGTGGIVNHGHLFVSPSGAVTLSNAVSGTGKVTGSSPGSVTLTGLQSYTGTTAIASAGMRLTFGGGHAHAIGSVTGTGTLHVAPGTSLTSDEVTVVSLVVEGQHTLRPGALASRVHSLTLGGAVDAWTGTLDLTSSGLIIQIAEGMDKPARIATLRNQLASGAITSSTADASVNALALADNADLGFTSFGGQFVSSTSLIIALAAWGDATLDGTVNAFDLNALAAHWQQGGTLWSSGDFTGDGKVDAYDLNLLASNWQSSSLQLQDHSGRDAGHSASIPEPASILLFAPVALLFSHRRATRLRAKVTYLLGALSYCKTTRLLATPPTCLAPLPPAPPQ